MQEQQKAIIKIHPEAIKTLVNSSWEYANEFFFIKFLINEEEKIFIKNCLIEYYWSIPPEEFQDKSNQYFSNFRREIHAAKREFDNSPDKKRFDPCNWMARKTKVNLRNEIDGRPYDITPVVIFDNDNLHSTNEVAWTSSLVR